MLALMPLRLRRQHSARMQRVRVDTIGGLVVVGYVLDEAVAGGFGDVVGDGAEGPKNQIYTYQPRNFWKNTKGGSGVVC